MLREADRDLGKELTVSDFCRKAGSSQNTYYRWRLRFDSAKVDEGTADPPGESEVEHSKSGCRLLLDKKMLQDIAKKVVTAAQQRHGRYRPGV